MRPTKVTCAQLIVVALIIASSPSRVTAQIEFEKPPIDYLNAVVNDPVTELARRVESGEIELAYDVEFGYLPAVLDALDVPESSQVLVFSKTSLQLHRIAPRRPRALYFNDDVYVGYCQKGDVLELASTDPNQGAIFYTLAQKVDEDTDEEKTFDDSREEKAVAPKPKFVRDRGGCLTCHASSRTQSVPGYLVRSVYPSAAGHPQLGSGSFTTDHTSDFRERWGGWYVTGGHGSMRHMGNSILRGEEHEFDRDPGANISDLSKFFKTEAYLRDTSDIVALMVLEHQTQMHNAITAANFETRLATHQSFQMNDALERPKDFLSESALRRIDAAADRVVQHLLFCDEFVLQDHVKGSNEFAETFAARGPFDEKGRSLRQFNLKTRLFEFQCSYLIYSPAFDALPNLLREKVYQRLINILLHNSEDKAFHHLDAKSRSSIHEILMVTKDEYAHFATTSVVAK